MRRLLTVLLVPLALTACGGNDNEGTRSDTNSEATDPVQETAAGEDVRARSVVIELEGDVAGTATLAPVEGSTRVTIQLDQDANGSGATILRGGCDGEPVEELALAGNTFDGTIPQTLDTLLEDDAVVGVEVQRDGQRLACGETDAQME